MRNKRELSAYIADSLFRRRVSIYWSNDSLSLLKFDYLVLAEKDCQTQTSLSLDSRPSHWQKRHGYEDGMRANFLVSLNSK